MHRDGEIPGHSPDRPAVVFAAPLGMILLGETPAETKSEASTCVRPPAAGWPIRGAQSAWQPLPDLFGVAQLDVGALLDELGVPLQEVDAPAG